MTLDEALAEVDRVNSQLAWHAAHANIARPEVIALLHDRRAVAELVIDRRRHGD